MTIPLGNLFRKDISSTRKFSVLFGLLVFAKNHFPNQLSAKNRDFVLGLGADAHIDYHTYDWTAHPREFDFVLDTIGGNNIDHSLEVTKEGGSIISIPTGLNEEVTSKAASKGVKGYFILVQSNGADMEAIASLLEKGTLKPHISQTFDFDRMQEAHLSQETGRTVGKIIITL